MTQIMLQLLKTLQVDAGTCHKVQKLKNDLNFFFFFFCASYLQANLFKTETGAQACDGVGVAMIKEVKMLVRRGKTSILPEK